MLKSGVVRYSIMFLLCSSGLGMSFAQEAVLTERGGYYKYQPPQNAHNAEYARQLSLEDARRRGFPAHSDDGRSVLRFRHPIEIHPDYKGNDLYTITYFRDHAPYLGVNQQIDWHCGDRTYDSAGGGSHTGTDYALAPFPWLIMDQEVAQVVAVEDGKIVSKVDGNFDRACVGNNGGNANLIIIEHAGKVQTMYLHLKKNSLTHKDTGEYVTKGEFLGYVGSSGWSTGPHLHFECIRPPAGNGQFVEIIDPFYDDQYAMCNINEIPGSMWADQEPYINPKILDLSTHESHISFGSSCEASELNASSSFCDEHQIFLYGFVRDIERDDLLVHRVIDPDGNVRFNEFATWQEDFRILGWSWTVFTIPSDAPSGVWRYQFAYNNLLEERTFNVCHSVSVSEQALGNLKMYPNPANDQLFVQLDPAISDIEFIRVVDVTGKAIVQERLDRNSVHALSVSDMASGMYMTTFLNESGAIIGSKRFVKH